ncbi:hypothetical protein FQR65_LT02420 [Abscondita terminalis]|nr:hypothetical protein FQR65_LT02420 [Abscondita terminalis]
MKFFDFSFFSYQCYHQKVSNFGIIIGSNVITSWSGRFSKNACETNNFLIIREL